MIRNSFIFLPGIKKAKEQSIACQGAADWDKFSKMQIKGISKRRKREYDLEIFRAKAALFESNSCYFYDKMPQKENWRLYSEFQGECVFLDIEASGPGREGYITVIGLYDGISTKTMIRGVNLDEYALKKELGNYKLILTFNGSSFDIPFLNKKYPGLLPKIPHIDLRHACARIGLFGGLKEIEKKLGIKRENGIVEKLYGGDPLKLWRMYLGSGDDFYLKLLVEYNEEDVISLKRIADYVIPVLEKNLKRVFIIGKDKDMEV